MVVLLVAAGWLTGCRAGERMPVDEWLRVASAAGAAPSAAVIGPGDVWRQGRGCAVEMIDPGPLFRDQAVQLGTEGRNGPVCDLAVVDDRLFAVLRDEAVLELDGRDLTLRARHDAARLGQRPRRLSVAGGDVYVTGDNGVTRLRDGRRWLEDRTVTGPVIVNPISGLNASIGRRVYRLDNGAYLGAAVALQNTTDPNMLVFAFNLVDGVAVGLMTPDIREIDRTVIPGVLRRLRAVDDLVFVATDQAAAVLRRESDRLVVARVDRMRGVADLVRLGPRRVGVVGAGFRARIRIDLPDEPPAVRRDGPVDLRDGWFEGRSFIVVESSGAAWLVNDDGGLTPTETAGAPLNDGRSARTIGVDADVAPDGVLMLTTAAGEQEFVDGEVAPPYVVAALDGDIWVGGDGGVVVLRELEEDAFVAVDRVRLPGLITRLTPDTGGRGMRYVGPEAGTGRLSWFRTAPSAF